MMHQAKTLGSLAVLIFGLALLTTEIRGAEAGADAATGASQDRPRQVLRHDAAAVIKLVPVRVLDEDGRPVRGLRKEDFTLTDNGKLMTITEFEVHESGEIRIAAEDEGAVEPAIEPEARPWSRPEPRRKIFFVLDMQGSMFIGNQEAKNTVLEFVENQLQPGDEAGVLTFGGLTGLVLRQYLTSDQDKIKKAIRRSLELGGGTAGTTGGRGSTRRGDDAEGSSTVLSDADFPFASGLHADWFDDWGAYWQAKADRSRADFNTSMEELAVAMKYIEGSKSVVYFSTRTPGRNASRLFAEANTTIYAVNTNVTPDKGGGAYASRQRKMKVMQGEALKGFAEASGGHYFADVKEAKTIAREVELLSGNFYVLGYYISPSWDGRLHKIEVEVDRPGLRVLAQKEYRDPKPFAELSDLEKQLHLYDVALSDKPASRDVLELPMKVLYGSAMAEANTAVLMKLGVDERTGVPPGRTEIFTLVFDKDHKIVLAERGEMDSAPYDRKAIYPYLLARLRPGDYEVRVLARGMETGQSAASRVPFTVPAPDDASRMSLSSPLLMVPGEKAEFMRMARPGKRKAEPMSIIRFYPFLPEKAVPLLDDLPPGIDKLWALIPVDCGEGRPDETELDVKLARADETDGAKEIRIDWGLIDKKPADKGRDFYLIGISLAGLEAGAYRLEFTLTDTNSGIAAAATATFKK